MPGWIESFLVTFFLAVGEKLAAKGMIRLETWKRISGELAENKKAAEKYQEVVDNPESTREDRRKAEDEIFG